jgi:hypothetical protein
LSWASMATEDMGPTSTSAGNFKKPVEVKGSAAVAGLETAARAAMIKKSGLYFVMN